MKFMAQHFLTMFGMVTVALQALQLETYTDIKQIREQGFFDLPLTFNRTSHLWMIPIYLGFHLEDYRESYWCALDFTIPSIIVPNSKCEECSGRKYTPESKDDTFEAFNYSHNMMYWKYTNGSFMVQEEQEQLILGYNASLDLADQIILSTFDFYSILEDNDEQKVDSLFGLGMQPPNHQEKEGYMNIMEWLKNYEYIKQKVASIYISNYDGTESEVIKAKQKKYNLPPSNIRFGDYNTTDIAKNNEIFFWTVTSKYNWTLDMYELQYGDEIFDIFAQPVEKDKEDDAKKGLFDPHPASNFIPDPEPQWQQDNDEEDVPTTQAQVIKALINPSSPFIALPKKLFKRIADLWLLSFPYKDDKPFCTDEFCIVMMPCTEVPTLYDFGIRLGSLNDTLPANETEDQDMTENILFRGKSEVERHKAEPQFFRIPFESYLLPGEKMGLQEDVCYLSVTGFIPDSERVVVLGQPFLQNYYTVLDMETMEIGLAAHIGTDAEISSSKFTRSGLLFGILLAFVIITILVCTGYYTRKYYQERRLQKKQFSIQEFEDSEQRLKDKLARRASTDSGRQKGYLKQAQLEDNFGDHIALDNETPGSPS